MEKQQKIVSMFDDIAPTYDTANRVMSMGVDKVGEEKRVILHTNLQVMTL